MNPIDWTNAFERFAGKWVALKDDHQTVVASGDSLKEAKQAAIAKGYSHPIVTRMPKTLRSFIGASV